MELSLAQAVLVDASPKVDGLPLRLLILSYLPDADTFAYYTTCHLPQFPTHRREIERAGGGRRRGARRSRGEVSSNRTSKKCRGLFALCLCEQMADGREQKTAAILLYKEQQNGRRLCKLHLAPAPLCGRRLLDKQVKRARPRLHDLPHHDPAARREQRAASLPSEPAATDAAATHIAVRLRDGRRVQRRFKRSDLLSLVLDWLGGIDPDTTSFQLATHYPRRAFEMSDHERTLEELGLSPAATLFLEEDDDDDMEDDATTADSQHGSLTNTNYSLSKAN